MFFMGSTKNIFISYRRKDSGDVTGRIYDRLCESFDEEQIFKDVDSIPIGVDFKKYIDEQVGQCAILLAIIGPYWTSVTDEDGNIRIKSSSDFVRTEIESALRRNIPVVPILVRNASMPKEDQLPETLKPLLFKNGTKVRADPDFHNDMDRLIHGLKKHLSTGIRIPKKLRYVLLGIGAIAAIITGVMFFQNRNSKQQPEPIRRNVIEIREAYKRAAELNTLEAYENFLAEYPDIKTIDNKVFTSVADSVRKIKSREEVKETDTKEDDLDKQYWEKASKANTLRAYEAYLKRYPQGQYAKRASLAIRRINSLSFVDSRDGKRYSKISIGNQVWMAQNLAYKPPVGNYWAYKGEQANSAKFGYLYDWRTAKRVCPEGWKLPSERDFKILIASTGQNSKESIKSLLQGGNSGFNALLAGMRWNTGSFVRMSTNTFFWSETPIGPENGWALQLYPDRDVIIKGTLIGTGASVRCIQE